MEQGKLADSPKHAALKRILGGISALAPVGGRAGLPGSLPRACIFSAIDAARSVFRDVAAASILTQPSFCPPFLLPPTSARRQGSRVCVVGQPKSFFTLYKAALATGQQVCQLDRDGRLARGGAGRDAVAAAVRTACASAACVLVPAELVAAGSFPLEAFQAVVVYASDPGTQAVLRPQLEGLPIPLHWLEVPLPALQQHAAPGATTAAAAAAPQKPGAARGAPAAGRTAARVQHAARPAPVAVAAQQQAALSPANRDWPVIISSDPGRPIR